MTTASTETRRPPRPFPIVRAQVAGLTPDKAHQAILAAIDDAVIAVTDTTDINPVIIAGAVAMLAEARKAIKDHAPYTLPAGETGTWCLSEGAEGPPWPCPMYREAASPVADGLGQ